MTTIAGAKAPALRTVVILAALCSVTFTTSGALEQDRKAPEALAPGTRVLLDAHNAYPDGDRFADRLDRALATGLPIAIEQDLVWYHDAKTGVARSIVSHGAPFTGREPTLEQYFFHRIRPLIERAFREGRKETWPVITLNLDFKTTEPEHLASVWNLLGKYESWLTTAKRTTDSEIADVVPGPLLVLTGESDEQAHTFHDAVPIGGLLRLFGAVHSRAQPEPSPESRTNYRRWWNNPWTVIELDGQNRAGKWTSEDEARLRRVVDLAHRSGLWIRFYTLNGHAADTTHGWTASYNFGSAEAAEQRWMAAIRAGVDFIAVDQYEEFARIAKRERLGVRLTGTLTHDDYERVFERTFEVPAGTERIDLQLTYDDRNRTVIDLGLRGPSGFRGWSGGGLRHVAVSTYSASYGYTPGPIEPGAWAVIVGVPNIRPGVTADYAIDVRTSASRRDGPVVRTGPGWYAGDLHAHSGHSDGRTVVPSGERVGVPPEHVFKAAAAAALDFVALTDHNTTSHWLDVDRLQSVYPTLLLLHGREVTTYRGHMNTFGETRFTDFRAGDRRSIAALAARLDEEGAFVSINHPERPDDETCMGCGWNDRDDETIRRLQGVEIVNGDREERKLAGWPFWAGMLNRGHRLTAIGGSDDHTPDDTVDGRIGRPTTVVYASELSEQALLEGLRAGRTYVRTRGPQGPVVDVWAEQEGRRFELGSTLPAGLIVLRATVDRASGQRATWIRNGEPLTTTVPANGRLHHDVTARAGDWFSLVLRDSSGPTLFSGAIYVTR